jgi:predicted nuclease of predicted toxin-antitoxin system
MKFLIDAQLPKSLAHLLSQNGHESMHTLDLTDKNKTTDRRIIEIAESENYIVITKDDDFAKAFYLKKQPSKLILVRTGNISNARLLEIFLIHIMNIESMLSENSFIEIFKDEIVIHSDRKW